MSFITNNETSVIRKPVRRGTLFLTGIVLSIFLSTVTSVRGDDQQTYQLRYKFQQGETVRYHVSLNDRYEIQVGETIDKPHSLQTSSKSYTVKSVNADGSAVLVLTPLENIKAEISQNEQQVVYDSSSGEKPPEIFAGMSDLLGKPSLEVTVTLLGQVIHIENLLKGAQKPEEVSQPALDLMVQLPEQAIKIGDTWKEDYEVNVLLPDGMLTKMVRMQKRYTLRSVENDLATIGLTTQIMTPVEPGEQMQLLRRTPSGTLKLNLKDGCLEGRELKQDNQVTGFLPSPSVMTFKQDLTETRIKD